MDIGQEIEEARDDHLDGSTDESAGDEMRNRGGFLLMQQCIVEGFIG